MSRVVAAAASEALECTQPAIIAFTTDRGDLTVNRNLEVSHRLQPGVDCHGVCATLEGVPEPEQESVQPVESAAPLVV